MTQKDVAKQLGVSRPTLTQMELGNRAVTSTELQRLAYLYGRDVRVLLAEEEPSGDPVLALFRVQPDIEGEDPLLSAVRGCLEIGREVTNLERLLGIDRDVGVVATYKHGPPRTMWEAIEQGQRAAREERRRLGLGSAPIANVAKLLETQGVRTAQVELPDDISGLTLLDDDIGIFVASNKHHSYERRRFSYAHEYAHVLLDRDRRGVVSRSANRDEFIEVRANSFAAEFLMPADGVLQQVRSMGKGHLSRQQMEIFDEVDAVEVKARAAPGSQEIQLYDVAQISYHFGTSRVATLYRLRNLRLITESQHNLLKHQESRHGKEVADVMVLLRPDDESERNEFRHRFLGLALEAYRREEITRDKLYVLARLIDVEAPEVDLLIDDTGIARDAGEDEPLLPEA